jgi:hypothetical protein
MHRRQCRRVGSRESRNGSTEPFSGQRAAISQNARRRPYSRPSRPNVDPRGSRVLHPGLVRALGRQCDGDPASHAPGVREAAQPVHGPPLPKRTTVRMTNLDVLAGLPLDLVAALNPMAMARRG